MKIASTLFIATILIVMIASFFPKPTTPKGLMVITDYEVFGTDSIPFTHDEKVSMSSVTLLTHDEKIFMSQVTLLYTARDIETDSVYHGTFNQGFTIGDTIVFDDQQWKVYHQ